MSARHRNRVHGWLTPAYLLMGYYLLHAGEEWIAMLLMWALNAALHNYEDKKHTWVLFSFVAIGAGLPQPGQNSAGHSTCETEAVIDGATDPPA